MYLSLNSVHFLLLCLAIVLKAGRPNQYEQVFIVLLTAETNKMINATKLAGTKHSYWYEKSASSPLFEIMSWTKNVSVKTVMNALTGRTVLKENE